MQDRSIRKSHQLEYAETGQNPAPQVVSVRHPSGVCLFTQTHQLLLLFSPWLLVLPLNVGQCLFFMSLQQRATFFALKYLACFRGPHILSFTLPNQSSKVIHVLSLKGNWIKNRFYEDCSVFTSQMKVQVLIWAGRCGRFTSACFGLAAEPRNHLWSERALLPVEGLEVSF